MTPDLQVIRESAERATPGPWEVEGPHPVKGGGEALAVTAPSGIVVATVGFDRGDPAAEEASRADAALVAAVPALLAHIAKLEKEAAVLWGQRHRMNGGCTTCAIKGEFNRCPTNPYGGLP